MVDTHSKRTTLLLDEQDEGSYWGLVMLNETLFKVFINVLAKCFKFILPQVINGPK
jgi:hypothetical protein